MTFNGETRNALWDTVKNAFIKDLPIFGNASSTLDNPFAEIPPTLFHTDYNYRWRQHFQQDMGRKVKMRGGRPIHALGYVGVTDTNEIHLRISGDNPQVMQGILELAAQFAAENDASLLQVYGESPTAKWLLDHQTPLTREPFQATHPHYYRWSMDPSRLNELLGVDEVEAPNRLLVSDMLFDIAGAEDNFLWLFPRSVPRYRTTNGVVYSDTFAHTPAHTIITQFSPASASGMQGFVSYNSQERVLRLTLEELQDDTVELADVLAKQLVSHVLPTPIGIDVTVPARYAGSVRVE